MFALPPPTITWTDDRNSSVVAHGGRFSISQTDSGNTRTSILTFNGILKEDESNYTCTAVNNVTNVINVPENGGSITIVQGINTYVIIPILYLILFTGIFYSESYYPPVDRPSFASFNWRQCHIIILVF